MDESKLEVEISLPNKKQNTNNIVKNKDQQLIIITTQESDYHFCHLSTHTALFFFFILSLQLQWGSNLLNE